MTTDVNVNILEGKTLTNIQKIENYELIFTTSDGERYMMAHDQDCCESVTIDDICGNLDDLVGTPIILAQESTSRDKLAGRTVDDYESFTWTFYRFSTFKGAVVIRWFGTSNGYYSESVSFRRVEPAPV